MLGEQSPEAELEMGWRGVVRDMMAAQRRAERAQEREAKRRHRELQAYEREALKWESNRRAAYEVDVHTTHIDLVKSLHKDVSYFYDWQAISMTPPPPAPAPTRTCETAALERQRAYSPSMMDRAMGKVESTQRALALDVEQSRQADAQWYQKQLAEHQQEHERWQWFQHLCRGVLSGESEAYRAALSYLTPLAEMLEFGPSVTPKIERSDVVEFDVELYGEKTIPTEEKRLAANGTVSTKPMPASRFNELYQDHVCSAALRVAGEAFATLPIGMVLVHVQVPLLDSATGRRGPTTVLSVAVARETFVELDLDRIDCSDSMRNFVHHMDFKKARGFAPVERVTPDDLQKGRSSMTAKKK
ncbi:Hypothetical protein A7982_04707 [Minicystis rosea]|nr:Hypothetical protein A7982_04707 [Minicystis rosea]